MFHPDPTIVLHSDPAAPQDHCGHKSAALPWSQHILIVTHTSSLVLQTACTYVCINQRITWKVKGISHQYTLISQPDILKLGKQIHCT